MSVSQNVPGLFLKWADNASRAKPRINSVILTRVVIPRAFQHSSSYQFHVHIHRLPLWLLLQLYYRLHLYCT